MFDSSEYITPSEQLVAFLDGELAPEETSTLFYELAQNQELQEEMRQLVVIRNTFRNSQLSPPAALKTGIMRRTGLKEYPLRALSKSGAALVALLYNKAAVSMLVLAALSIAAVIWMNDSESRIKQTVEKNSIAAADTKPVPVMESTAENNQSSDYFKAANGKGGSVSTHKSISRVTVNSMPPETNSALTEIQGSVTGEIIAPMNIDASDMAARMPFTSRDISFTGKRRLAYLDNSVSRFLQDLKLYVRFFPGASFPSFELNGDKSPLVNNFAVGLKYDLDRNHSIGFVYGQENFLMDFDNEEASGVIRGYKQSWNGYWFGLTYQYNFEEIGDTGLRPEVNVLAGATVVGPVLRSSVGLNYDFTENFYMTGGLEFGTLIYSSNGNFNTGNIYSTNKIGATLGIGVGF